MRHQGDQGREAARWCPKQAAPVVHVTWRARVYRPGAQPELIRSERARIDQPEVCSFGAVTPAPRCTVFSTTAAESEGRFMKAIRWSAEVWDVQGYRMSGREWGWGWSLFRMSIVLLLVRGRWGSACIMHVWCVRVCVCVYARVHVFVSMCAPAGICVCVCVCTCIQNIQHSGEENRRDRDINRDEQTEISKDMQPEQKHVPFKELVPRQPCWPDPKTALLAWSQDSLAGLIPRQPCWPDPKTALLAWAQDSLAGLIPRQPCWPDPKTALLAWSQDSLAGLIPRQPCLPGPKTALLVWSQDSHAGLVPRQPCWPGAKTALLAWSQDSLADLVPRQPCWPGSMTAMLAWCQDSLAGLVPRQLY